MKKLLQKVSILALAALCLLSLSACKSKEQQQQEMAHKKIVRNNDNLPNGQYFANSSLNGQRKRALNQVAKQMDKNYHKIGNVKYNQANDTVTLNLTGNQMQNLIQAARQNNGQAKKFWKQLTTGMNKTSTNISKQLKDNNLKFNIVSPTGKKIYSVSNEGVSTNAFK